VLVLSGPMGRDIVVFRLVKDNRKLAFCRAKPSVSRKKWKKELQRRKIPIKGKESKTAQEKSPQLREPHRKFERLDSLKKKRKDSAQGRRGGENFPLTGDTIWLSLGGRETSPKGKGEIGGEI